MEYMEESDINTFREMAINARLKSHAVERLLREDFDSLDAIRAMQDDDIEYLGLGRAQRRILIRWRDDLRKLEERSPLEYPDKRRNLNVSHQKIQLNEFFRKFGVDSKKPIERMTRGQTTLMIVRRLASQFKGCPLNIAVVCSPYSAANGLVHALSQSDNMKSSDSVVDTYVHDILLSHTIFHVKLPHQSSDCHVNEMTLDYLNFNWYDAVIICLDSIFDMSEEVKFMAKQAELNEIPYMFLGVDDNPVWAVQNISLHSSIEGFKPAGVYAMTDLSEIPEDKSFEDMTHKLLELLPSPARPTFLLSLILLQIKQLEDKLMNVNIGVIALKYMLYGGKLTTGDMTDFFERYNRENYLPHLHNETPLDLFFMLFLIVIASVAATVNIIGFVVVLGLSLVWYINFCFPFFHIREKYLHNEIHRLLYDRRESSVFLRL